MTAIGPGVRVKCVKSGLPFNTHGYKCPSQSVGGVYVIEGIVPPMGIYLTVDKSICQCCGLTNAQFIDRFIPLDGNEDISSLIEASKKGPVESDERVRVVERVR